ncbi:peptide ABC transporter permease [Frateuria sp. Soil773]|uniref:ABC transporter permease n=1 Tax=Frateuria sp. Soil773 TaxID=1736407 RepID=UPI0006F2DAF0|nr:ABC transporter permease [Frateuria sp. Soil773]KRE88602.1 peptide ABC transporter permease [Frateuria sp. Soil773]
MFGYYLDLAVRSLKRSPGLTALMVLAIGFGVAASMTSWSVFRAVSGDPIPWKSSKLFVPQIDNWGPQGRDAGAEPPNAMSYADATTLMRDHRAKRQSAMYQISPSIVPADASKHPINVSGHAVFGEFFPMLETPFLYGSGWSAADDANRAQVAVISGKLNQKLFGGVDSVGQNLSIEGGSYRVVGVLDDWNPQPRFYDVVNSGGFDSGSEDVFVPFLTAIQAGIPNDGNTNCNATPKESGFVGLQHSECVWIAYMAELDDAAAAKTYRDYLQGYAREQQQAGRFSWAPNNRLRNLPDWLDNQHVVPSDTKVSLLVALGLLLVCLVNTIGLLLAKFLRRSAEIGVRRALGAPRAAIYMQFLTEAGIVGAAGGVLGLLLTCTGVASVGWVMPKDIADLARLDVSLLVLTMLVAVVATMLAGLYPTYRASRVQPAWQLKSN